MTLLKTLKKAPPSGRKLDQILAKVSDDERVALEEALGSPEWSSAALARTLTALVQKVSSSTVERYRKDVLGLTFE